MKNIFSLVCALACIHSLHAQDLPTELQMPEIVSANRMPMRASAFAFENSKLAEDREKEKSAYFLSLNRTWKFNWVQDPRLRPQNFYKKEFNDASWKDFKVPANWEMNGHGLPIYVNQPYEFAGHGKRIMAYGGDFPLEGPVPQNISDNNFCVKGVVTAS